MVRPPCHQRGFFPIPARGHFLDEVIQGVIALLVVGLIVLIGDYV
jgi:hypothetical protein